MTKLIRYALLLAVLFITAAPAAAQSAKWQDAYRVKKKDTLYGIAKKYDLTVEELMKANPDLVNEKREIKKDDILLIPYPTAKKATSSSTTAQTTAKSTTKAGKKEKGTITVGVMLPLHNVDGDGQRMVEYYRGLLLACDDLKRGGASIDVKAWNVPIDADIRQTLLDPGAADCDIIFGPLYTKQVKPLADFCKKKNIRLVIPFSISGNDVLDNAYIYKVYQTPAQIHEASINAFIERFSDCHPVFVDCNDTTSNKGTFTFELRKRLETDGIRYNITNLKSSEAYFAKAFSTSQRNVVILNTGRSPELNVALAKLDGLKALRPDTKITLFGYTEWLMYTKVYLEYFHKYDAYIPTTFYYNPVASKTVRLNSEYRRWFGTDMRAALPQFAITGYDHAQFFICGLRRYGKSFEGTQKQSNYVPLQTPLKFVRTGNGGGMLNKSFMLIHYKQDHSIESLNY